MSKHSTAFKLKVVQYYLSKHVGCSRTATHFGINAETVRRWVAVYQQHGNKALAKSYTHRSLEFKLTVLKWIETEHSSVAQACAHFNIPSLTPVRDWQRRYNTGGIQALTNKPRGRPKAMPEPYKPSNKPLSELSPEELLRELQYLRAENAYLKKLKALVQSKQSAIKKKR